MMRLKKGSKVEVFGGDGVPPGSWIPGEIISGNGHHYSIRYDREQPDVGAVIATKVPRKLIRPPPPPAQPSGDWEPADIVEVLDQGVWKPGEVSMLAEEGYFVVKFVGCSETSKVHPSNLRTRQMWKNNQWRVMGKESVLEAEKKFNNQGPDFDEQMVMEDKNGHPLKRKLRVTSRYSAKNVSAIDQLPRRRAIKKGREAHNGAQWMLPEDDFLGLPEEVVAISPKNKLAGKCVFTSNPKRRKRCAMESDKRISSARGLDYDKAGSDELSACSSYGSNSMNLLYPRSSARCHPDIDEQSDDAHSCTGIASKRQSMTLACEALSAEVHKLELQAYRSTLEAFYASGPMSWEQESLISNLRSVLHISDDEHLFELRSLTSRESNVVCHREFGSCRI